MSLCGSMTIYCDPSSGTLALVGSIQPSLAGDCNTCSKVGPLDTLSHAAAHKPCSPARKVQQISLHRDPSESSGNDRVSHEVVSTCAKATPVRR